MLSSISLFAFLLNPDRATEFEVRVGLLDMAHNVDLETACNAVRTLPKVMYEIVVSSMI